MIGINTRYDEKMETIDLIIDARREFIDSMHEKPKELHVDDYHYMCIDNICIDDERKIYGVKIGKIFGMDIYRQKERGFKIL